MPLAPGLIDPADEDQLPNNVSAQQPLQDVQMPEQQIDVVPPEQVDPRAANQQLIRDYFSRQGKLAQSDPSNLQVTPEEMNQVANQRNQNQALGAIYSNLAKVGSFGGKVQESSMPQYFAQKNADLNQDVKMQDALYNQGVANQDRGAKGLMGLENFEQGQVKEGQEQQGFEQNQALGDLKLQAAQRADDAAERMQDPDSAESQQARLLAQKYFPKSAAQFKDMSAQEIQPFLDQAEKAFSVEERTQMLRQRAQELGLQRQAMAQQKQQAQARASDEKNDKDFMHMAEKLNGDMASSRSGLGKNTQVINQGGKVLALINQGEQQPGGLDVRQVQEAAKSLDNMLSGGGATVSGTHELLPQSLQSKFASAQEFLSGNPTGAQLQKFVARMKETVQREIDVAEQQRQKAVQGSLAGYSHLKKADPDRFNAVLSGLGLNGDAGTAEAPQGAGRKVISSAADL